MDFTKIVGEAVQNLMGYLSVNPLLVVGMVGLVIVIAFLKRVVGAKRYQAQKYLITPTEQKSYRYFEQALSGLPARLFAQVRIADVISVKGKQNRSWWRAFAKISSKHVDFVVTRSDFSIAACIEVDDASHERRDRKKRDQLVDRVFQEAGLPLIRVKPGQEAKGITEIKSVL